MPIKEFLKAVFGPDQMPKNPPPCLWGEFHYAEFDRSKWQIWSLDYGGPSTNRDAFDYPDDAMRAIRRLDYLRKMRQFADGFRAERPEDFKEELLPGSEPICR